MPKTTVHGIRFAPDVLAFLKAKSAAEQRSLTFLVNATVREAMAREAKAKAKKAKG